MSRDKNVLPVQSVSPASMRIDDRFWSALPESSRGAWSVHDLSSGQAHRFRASDILVVEDMVSPTELHMLISLVQSCEGFFSTGPCGGDHDLDRIERVRALPFHQADYAATGELIAMVSRDLHHDPAVHAGARLDERGIAGLTVSRRFMRPRRAPLRAEQASMDPSQWLLFLNDDYTGGELLFPTRRRMVRPRGGTAVRWPSGIPYAIAVTTDGYQFTMQGRSV